MSRSILIALSLCALGKERKEPTTFEHGVGEVVKCVRDRVHRWQLDALVESADRAVDWLARDQRPLDSGSAAGVVEVGKQRNDVWSSGTHAAQVQHHRLLPEDEPLGVLADLV